MNFSLGFFVGGQVLAGILGSTVTYGYGSEGKHAANYLQTAAASVAGMSGLGVLHPGDGVDGHAAAAAVAHGRVPALHRHVRRRPRHALHPDPGRSPAAHLSLGPAVANILRALTDPVLLRASVLQLGSGIGTASHRPRAAKVAAIGAIEVSASTFGAGMVVGARIGIPAITAALLGEALVPSFISIGWLEPATRRARSRS
jgi:hypothetical protein